jgi:hypothetical protein
MVKINSKLGKLGLAILENFVESKLGEKFITELRGPTDRQIAITWAIQSTSDRLWNEWEDKRLWNAIFNHLPEKKGLLTDLKEAVKIFYEHPTNTRFAIVLAEILHEHHEFTEELISASINRYIDVLTEELVSADKTFRESRGAVADLRSEKMLQIIAAGTARTADIKAKQPTAALTDVRAGSTIQLSPIFISYSHMDSEFVDMIGMNLDSHSIRFWRDTTDATSGPLEKIVDLAMRSNPTVLLVLSKDSVESDWVEYEARLARRMAIELRRDVFCPVAIDDAWKTCAWPARLREQIMEYNILDFSMWKDEAEFGKIFRKLIDGLDLFYKEG